MSDYRQPGALQWDNPNVKPLEVEVSRLGRELRLAQESKNRELIRAAQTAYEQARQKWETAEAEAYVRNRRAYRPKGAGTVKDSVIGIAALLAALLAWYESSQSQERNNESGWDLTRYRPKPRAW